MPFSLAAYLARIGLKEPPAADANGLALLQRAHRLAIPFENLDVVLGRSISIDSDAVFGKLVRARRGGYCFEHGQLFLDALDALGFTARPLLARVWLGAEAVPPLLHTLALVTIDGAKWIADAGFGGSYTPPMPLEEGAEAETPDGARHILREDPVFGWMLSRLGDARMTDGRSAEVQGPRRQYSFTTEEVYPADLALANHWTQTAPTSRFVDHPIVSIVLPRGFASLNGRGYRRATVSEATEAEIASPRALRMRLSLMFGIDLSEEEVAALGLY